MDWYLAIKCAKLKLLRFDFPDLSEDEVNHVLYCNNNGCLTFSC